MCKVDIPGTNGSHFLYIYLTAVSDMLFLRVDVINKIGLTTAVLHS